MRTISKGDKGKTVEFLQQRLWLHGFIVNADGDFGHMTEEAVEQFQAAHHLKVDGVVGDKTWDALLVTTRVKEPADLLDEQKRWLLTKLHSSKLIVSQANQVAMKAIDDLGEAESPDGSNGGPGIAHLVDGYNEYWGLPPSPMQPWCAIALCSWMRLGLGKKKWSDIPLGNWWGAVSQIESWAKKNGKSHPTSVLAEPGMIFTMGRSSSSSDSSASTTAGHTGYVVADDGTHIITVEGNVSNKVQSRRRQKSDLRSFIVWW